MSAIPSSACDGYTPFNPPEWIERLRPQVVLLSAVAASFVAIVADLLY
jgi:hypothetical protein